jgi:hypothetical protein
MQAHGGAFDIAMDFGYRATSDQDPIYDVRVTMSWEHLKLMLGVLQGQIAQYEEQVGTIPNLIREPQGVGSDDDND